MTSISASAPARVSFAGGGTDLPAYADRFGGAVVSCTLDRLAEVRVTSKMEGLELIATDAGVREMIPAAAAARRLRSPILAEQHLLFPKAAAALHRLERGRIEVSSAVPIGAGLASSGSLAVALAAAVRAFVGESADPAAVAEDAFTIEAGLLARPVGRQDQYAAAFGGMNLIEFTEGAARVTPLDVDLVAVSERLLLVGDGTRRDAAVPLSAQHARTAADDPATLAALDEMKASAYRLRDLLEAGDLDAAGEEIDRAWRRKRELALGLANDRIDEALSAVWRAGAIGAKLCGAGTSGTLLVWCEAGARETARGALEALGWHERTFHLSRTGVRCAAGSVTESADG